MPYPTQDEKFSVRLASHWLTPLLLSVLNVWFFFYVIPDYIAQRFSVTFAIVGGVLALIFAFWLVALAFEKVLERFPIAVGLTCISTIFIFGYFFIVQTSGFRSNELKTYGLKADAVIVDKTRIFSPKGGSIQNMDVAFKTAKGESMISTIDLGANEYDRFEEGMLVPIYYSSKNPDIARLNYRAFNSMEAERELQTFPFDRDLLLD